jgi:excisionase family DNA binding protein
VKISERVAELLNGVPVEEQLRCREVPDAAKLLGVSPATLYRLISEDRIGRVKLAGKQRRGGRGRAGSVRVRLIDIVEFQVKNERRASS